MKKPVLDDLATSLFCRDMSMLYAAGTQPDEALGILCEDAGEGRFAGAAKALADAMAGGASFARAAADTGVLPVYAARMIAAGERAGRTEEVLDRLADYYERQNSLRERLRSALVYPLFLLLLMCGVLAFLVGRVVPVFIGVYENLSGSLAGSSYAYAAAARVVSWAALLVTLTVCILLAAGMAMAAFPRSRGTLLHFLEKFPLTAAASRRLAVSRLTDTLATFTASGLDADAALQEAAGMVEHRGLSAQISACQKDMAGGMSLAQAFHDHRVLEPLYGRMLQSGSRSGHLEEVLTRLAAMSGSDAENSIYAVIETIEPLLTGFLTLSVGIALLAAMLPLAGILGSIG